MTNEKTIQQPWDRLHGEHAKPYYMFTVYRDMGWNRNAKKTAEACGVSIHQIRNLMQKRNWIERADAWDRYVEKEKQGETIAKIKDMSERHAQIALFMQSKLANRLKGMDDAQVSKMSTTEFRQWILDSIDLERTARGAPNNTTALTGPGGTSELPSITVRLVKPNA